MEAGVTRSSTWSGRAVFVTGGNGFLGSHLVRALADAGARVTCLVRRAFARAPFFSEGTSRRVECVPGAVEDLDLLKKLLRERHAEALFHLAAQPIVSEALRDPLATMEANVRGTYHVLEAARQWGGLGALVCTTSDKVYSPSLKPPYAEDSALGGDLPYEASKVCADVLARAYAVSFGLPIGVARMGNLYGPGDLHWSRIVPGTCRALLQGSRPIIRSDGTPLRDYFYVGDAARGLLALGEALLRGEAVGEALNFGTGKPTSVREVVSVIVARSQRDLQPIVLGEARGEIPSQWLDCARARKMLGWAPQVGLEEGIDRAWGWYEPFFAARETALLG